MLLFQAGRRGLKPRLRDSCRAYLGALGNRDYGIHAAPI